MREYTIVIRPLDGANGGGYLGNCPDLPGCMSDGTTRAEALANTEKAIAEWLDTARDMGRAPPEPVAYSKLDDLRFT